MKNKYYTPTIDEFHIGFEYEVSNKPYREGYDMKVFTEEDMFDDSFMYHFEVNRTKVKYLDKEDIESLGWEKSNRYEGISKFWVGYDLNGYQLVMGTAPNNINPYKITIDNGETHDMNITYFQGIIKNKSELKRLMKQLNINEQL